MHLYLDTSTNNCVVKLSFGEERPDFGALTENNDISTEQSPADNAGVVEITTDLGRDMAEKLHGHLHDIFQQYGKDWHDLASITYFSGPGSFTGLRIGASVVNALADQLKIPLFDHHGNQHQVILPDYGRPANISAQKE